jgi:hypothetical protein
MDKRQRLALLGIAAVIAAVAIVIAVTSGGGNDKSSTSTGTAAANGQTAQQTTADKPAAPQRVVEKVVVKGGQPVGGLKKIKLKKNQLAEIDVTSDTADEGHLHGYNIEKELPAGKTVRYPFKATIEGVFEMELHHAGNKIAQITVTP